MNPAGPAAAPGRRHPPARGHVPGLRGLGPDLAVVVPPWLVGHAVVLGSLALVRYLSDQVRTSHQGPRLHRVGLLGWDAAYYRDLAAHGYAALPHEALRFYPLVPLLVRGLSLPVGRSHAGPVLLALVAVASLAYGLVLVRLAAVEGLDPDVRSRAVWLLMLAPPAFVLVMGYSEAVFGLLAVLAFLGLRQRHWLLAAVAGALAGACRPVGVLLVVPAVVEAARGIRDVPRGERARRAAAVLGPAVGAGAYLAWVGARFGDALAPLRVQQSTLLHGAGHNPLHTLAQAARGTFHGQLGTGLHLPWLVLFVVLLVAMTRLLPASYAAWSAVTLGAAVVGSNLDSLERYAWGCFPFVLVAGLLLARREVWRVALSLSAALLVVYATLAFLTFSVP